jgi:hypothetical protein
MKSPQQTTAHWPTLHPQLKVLLSDRDVLGLTPCMLQRVAVMHTYKGRLREGVERKGGDTATVF